MRLPLEIRSQALHASCVALLFYCRLHCLWKLHCSMAKLPAVLVMDPRLLLSRSLYRSIQWCLSVLSKAVHNLELAELHRSHQKA